MATGRRTARNGEEAMRMLGGKPGCVDIVDADGNTRMQVVIPRGWKSTGVCTCCGEPLYCDGCKDG